MEDVDDRGGSGYVEREYISVFSSPYFYKLKTALKIMSVKNMSMGTFQ